MCPTKEDELVPLSEGQEAALNEETGKITFTEYLLSSSYCPVCHLITPAIHYIHASLLTLKSAAPLLLALCSSPFPTLPSLPPLSSRVTGSEWDSNPGSPTWCLEKMTYSLALGFCICERDGCILDQDYTK